VPVACTLDAGALAGRIDEWRALVASSVVAVETEPSSVRFVLERTNDALVAAVSLGEREKRCCAFFDVTVELDGERRALRLSVPAGAEEALGAFVAALRP
jgi:anti-sigma-K factor RskA